MKEALHKNHVLSQTVRKKGNRIEIKTIGCINNCFIIELEPSKFEFNEIICIVWVSLSNPETPPPSIQVMACLRGCG